VDFVTNLTASVNNKTYSVITICHTNENVMIKIGHTLLSYNLCATFSKKLNDMSR